MEFVEKSIDTNQITTPGQPTVQPISPFVRATQLNSARQLDSESLLTEQEIAELTLPPAAAPTTSSGSSPEQLLDLPTDARRILINISKHLADFPDTAKAMRKSRSTLQL